MHPHFRAEIKVFDFSRNGRCRWRSSHWLQGAMPAMQWSWRVTAKSPILLGEVSTFWYKCLGFSLSQQLTNKSLEVSSKYNSCYILMGLQHVTSLHCAVHWDAATSVEIVAGVCRIHRLRQSRKGGNQGSPAGSLRWKMNPSFSTSKTVMFNNV